MPVSWTRVGHPTAARRIALQHSGPLFAMNDDKTLWTNESDGADGAWRRVSIPSDRAAGVPPSGSLPTDTHAIAVGSSMLYYHRGMDRSLWSLGLAHIDSGVDRSGRPWGAAEIAGTEDNRLDFPFLYALNDDKTLWRNGSAGADGGWERVGQPFMAGRIASTQQAVYALLEDKTLMRNADHGTDGSWEMIDRPRYAVEIAAATRSPNLDEDVLYALNGDLSLWGGELT